MESTQPQPISTLECAPVNGKSATPFSQQRVVLTKQDYIMLKWEANYWRAQHACLVQREANRRLNRTKSEKAPGADSGGQRQPISPRKREQQRGTDGHGRSDRETLP